MIHYISYLSCHSIINMFKYIDIVDCVVNDNNHESN